MNIHSMISNSSVNGPGSRYVIWLQGCSLNCSGCWNPETHLFNIGKEYSLTELLLLVCGEKNIQGITISGGEPFQQPDDLFELTKMVKEETKLTQVVYSGYTIDEIQNQSKMKAVLSNIDVLIDGRFDSSKLSNNSSIGSINQKHHFLTNRYTIYDFHQQNRLEYHFPNDGSTSLTGFPIGV